MTELLEKSKRLRGSGGSPGGDKDNLFADDLIEVVLAISEGEIKGIKDDSLKNLYFNGVPHTSNQGVPNFAHSEFKIVYDVGTADPKPVAYELEGSSSTVDVNQPLTFRAPKVMILPSGAGTSFNLIQVRIEIDQLVKQKSDGAYKNVVEFDIEWQIQSEGIWRPLMEELTQYINAKTTTGTAAEYTGKISNEPIVLDGSETYSVRVTKRTEDSTDKSKTDITFSTVSLIVSKEYTEAEVHPYLAYLRFFGKTGEQLTGTPTLTAVWQGLLCSVPTNYDPEAKTYDESIPWDGQFKVDKEFTNNPFWIIRELALNPRFGLASTLKYISVNDYELYVLARHADESVPSGTEGETQPRFTFNGVIDEPMDGLDLINYIAGSAFARVFDGLQGELRVVADRNDPSVMLLTPESVFVEGESTFSYSKTDLRKRSNEIVGNYIEPNMEWASQRIQLKDSAAIQRFGRIQSTQQLIGCTDRHEGYRKLKYLLTTAQTEVLSVSFSMPMSGILLEPYQIVDIADPDMGWALSGRVISIDNLTVNLRDALTFDEYGTVTLKFQSSTAGIITRTAYIEKPGNYTQLTLNLPILEDLPKYCVFTVESDRGLGLSKPFRILRIDEIEGRPDAYAVTAIEINRNKFGDSDNAIITDGAIPAPQYGFQAAVVVKSPYSITVSDVRNERDDLVDLTISWLDPNPEGLNPVYLIKLIKNNQVFRMLETTGNKIEVDSVTDSEFVVVVQVTNSMGTASSDEFNYWSNYEDIDSINDDWITRGTGSIVGGFVEGDLKFEVLLSMTHQTESGVIVDLIAEPTILTVKAEIRNPDGQLVQTLSNINGNFTYTNQMNAIDHGGIATSNLRVSIFVTTIDYENSIILVDRLYASDGVPVITQINISSMANGVLAVPVFDELLTKVYPIEWALSETDEVGFLEDNIVSRSETLNISTLKPNTTYYLWVRFGNGFAQVFPSTPEGLTFDSGALSPGDVGALNPGDLDDLFEAPAQPTITSIVEGDNADLRIRIDTQANDKATMYEVMRSIGDETNYQVIYTVPDKDVVNDGFFDVLDTSIDAKGVIYYAAYAINRDTYSTIAKNNFNLGYDIPDPTDVVISEGAFDFSLTWANPDNAIFKHVEIYVEARTETSGFLEANSSLVYTGRGQAFNYEVPEADRAKYHQFWLKSIERT